MKKRIFPLFLALILAVSVTACGSKNASGDGRSVTVTVVHGDKSSKDFTYTSQAESLGEVLLEEGLVSGEDGPYGLFIQTVDGETADEAKEQWWCLTKGGEGVNTGVDTTPFEDGDQFELTLTEGY